MKKKILALLMIILMCMPVMAPVRADAANTSYKEWLQSDPAWADIRLGSSDYTMKSSGCLVTAIAMLVCHTGSASADSFSPATMVNYLNSNNGFTSGGALIWDRASGVVDGFKLADWKISLDDMTQSQKTQKMAECLKNGYGVIISVKDGGHWVALDRIENDTVYMMDPAGSRTDLYATYDVSGIDRLALFKGKSSSGTVIEGGGSAGNTDTVIASGKVNCSSLYVRSGPGTNNGVVTSLTRDEKVEILAEAKDSSGTKWYKVRVNGDIGYVCAEYITVTSGSTNGSGSGSQQASGTGTVNCSSLNVRSGIGTNYGVVTTVSKGQSMTITSKGKDSSGDLWYGVSFTKGGSSYKGYVFAQYVTVSNSSNNNSNNNSNNSDDNTSGGSSSIPAVVNCSELNMRSGAGTNYDVVTTLTKGTAVEIIGEKKDASGTLWYQISVNGKKGYVHSAYLTKKDASGNNGGDSSSSMSGKTMVVAYDAVNMRSGAGTSKSVVGVVHKGDKVTVTGQAKDGSGNIWYAVKTASGTAGYIRSDLLQADSSAGSSNNGGSNNSSSGSSSAEGQKMKVVYDGVNMRSGAGLNYGVVEVIYFEDTLTVLGEAKDDSGNVWYKVKAASGSSGYIRSDMLKSSSSSSSQQDPSTGTVVGGWLNVRKGAGTSYEVLTLIPEGTKVTIIGSEKDSDGSLWYQITCTYGGSNYKGYVFAQYIKK